MISLLKVLLIVLGLFGATQISRAQNPILVGRPDSFARAKDLTKFVETQCVNQLREQVGSNVILEIRYDRPSTELAQKIVSRMKEPIARTFEILNHSGPLTVRIYLAKIDNLPAGYKFVSNSSKDFVWPIIYDDKTNLNLDCDSITTLCEAMYVIPHELTHHLTEAKFAVNARWMEEGLCEYVSGLVGSKLSPRQAWKREMETLPEVSLNSEEIRNRLLRWNYTPETMTEESVLFYGASHQMMSLIIAEAEKQGEKEPRKKILTATQNHDGSFTSEEVLTILNKGLKVDVTKLGVLDAKRKTEIFEAAKSTYLRERYNKKTGYRYNSLNTFAYSGEQLSDEFLVALIEEVFDEKGDRLFRRLSAKALLLRLDQTTFDRTRASDALRRTKIKKYNSLDAFRKYLSNCCND